MPDPGFLNAPATEAAADTIRGTTEIVSNTASEAAQSAQQSVQQFRHRFQDRWRRMNDRVAEATAQLPAFKRELRDNAVFVAGRVRDSHRRRPLNVLGLIVAAAFVLGVTIGLGRH
jgi:hypothetical protein